jgi:hypothetical protein
LRSFRGLFDQENEVNYPRPSLKSLARQIFSSEAGRRGKEKLAGIPFPAGFSFRANQPLILAAPSLFSVRSRATAESAARRIRARGAVALIVTFPNLPPQFLKMAEC